MDQFKISNGFVAADRRHAAFVEIPEPLRLSAVDHRQNVVRCMTSLLHRNRRDTRQWLTSLVRKIRQVADHLHFWMIRNGQIFVHDHATDAIDGCAE